jgi:hypothetical protein
VGVEDGADERVPVGVEDRADEGVRVDDGGDVETSHSALILVPHERILHSAFPECLVSTQSSVEVPLG